jgi:hypothetical protein
MDHNDHNENYGLALLVGLALLSRNNAKYDTGFTDVVIGLSVGILIGIGIIAAVLIFG